MAQFWPLLDIHQAAQDAARNLADVVYYVETLQDDSGAQYPPDADVLLANVAQVRKLLTELIPPALAQAIAAEQAEYDDQADRWEPVNH